MDPRLQELPTMTTETTTAAIAAYAASTAGGGNPEAVIMRAIAAGRNTPQAWSAEFMRARGHGFSGDVAKGLVRGGILTFNAETGAYGFTAETEAWIVGIMASYPAVFRGHDAGGLAIYSNVAL